MKVKSFYGGGFAAVSYLVTDDQEGCGVIIDPAISYEAVLAEVHAMPKICVILLTHGHFDHMLFLADWKKKTGAPIAVSREDASALTDPELNGNRLFFGTDTTYPAADVLLSEGDKITFGGETLSVMHTPGHTRGSCVYLGDGVLFTGDTMMADGAYGRYDLPGGSVTALRDSLLRIAALTGDYTLYPGHGGKSTLNDEKNYYIR